jgi:alkanesulfonate monooxygenase SsuD/methylene tetrahydromethanopterin reductase-like flavin-dependent oxidoreductase (luciferase family)
VRSAIRSQTWPDNFFWGALRIRRNREIFEELNAIMKAAWTEDAFDFKGRYYQVPHPYESGLAHWPAAGSWTSKYGAAGELDAHGRIRRISVVPKPYTLHDPPIWQPVTSSEETIRWCARQDIHPIFLIGPPDNLKASYAIYRDEMARHGRNRALGEGIVTLGVVNIGDTYEAAYRLEEGALGAAFDNYFAHFCYGKVYFPRHGEQWLPQRRNDRRREASFSNNPRMWHGMVLLVYRAGCDGVG